ncbi:MAG: hypothetical protein R3B13_12230 [Polyangiaceae bacterium]
MGTAPPPDFRYVGLEPGPDPRRARRLGLGAGFGAFGLGVAMAGAEPSTVIAAAVAGSLSALLAVRGLGPLQPSGGERSARLSIVPWGIIVHDEPSPRVLRWAAVQAIDVRYVHEMDHATPAIRWSVVRVRTERELFVGRAPGAVGLESLEAHLQHYAEEASRPIALDLEGKLGLEDPLDPVFERLLAESRYALAKGALTERLTLPPASYRRVRGAAASSDAESQLRHVLGGVHPSAADPRPFAAILAAEIGARGAIAELLPLAACPHPLVATVARAAALRLGATVRATGALAELEDFVDPSELAVAEAYGAAAA